MEPPEGGKIKPDVILVFCLLLVFSFRVRLCLCFPLYSPLNDLAVYVLCRARSVSSNELPAAMRNDF